jgi:hypothetical protein
MPGHIGQDKHQRRQVFRQLSDKPVNAGDYRFFPWAAPPTKTRDSAPVTPATIGAAHAQTHTLEKIVGLMNDIGQRIGALEAKRSAQKQLAEQLALQPRPAQVQFEQPNHQPTQDHAAPCSCQHQHVLTPQRSNTHDGAKVMLRNPGLAPNRFITHDVSFAREVERIMTRDQNNFGEKPPSRFSSEENTRLSYSLPSGSAGPVPRENTKRANMGLEHPTKFGEVGSPIDWSGRDSKTQYNVSGQPQPAMTQGSDLSSAFASELQAIPSGQPNAGLNAFNRAYHGAKTSDARDKIERIFRDWQSSYDARGGMSPFMPRQPEARDAGAMQTVYGTGYVPGTSLAEGNTIKPGGGGGIHPIASSGGSDPGSNAFNTGPRAMGPVGSYGGAGDLKSGEGAPAGAPGAHNSANVPTPPVKPDLSESSSGSSSSGETPTPPVKPPSLGGTGESPEGLNPQAGEGGGASSTGSEGTGLAKWVKGLVQGETE